MKYCPKCGTAVPEEASFCPKCGTNFPDAAAPPPPVSELPTAIRAAVPADLPGVVHHRDRALLPSFRNRRHCQIQQCLQRICHRQLRSGPRCQQPSQEMEYHRNLLQCGYLDSVLPVLCDLRLGLAITFPGSIPGHCGKERL